MYGNSRAAEGAKTSIDTRMEAEDAVRTTEYHSAIRKDGIVPFAAAWMELKSMTLGEVREAEVPDFSPMWNLRNKTKNHRGRGKIG